MTSAWGRPDLDISEEPMMMPMGGPDLVLAKIGEGYVNPAEIAAIAPGTVPGRQEPAVQVVLKSGTIIYFGCTIEEAMTGLYGSESV